MLRSLTNLLLVTLALFNCIDAGYNPVAFAQSLPNSPLQETLFITGTITKIGDGLPLQGATITVNPGNVVAITDAEGFYSISVLSPGSYTATPSLAGFTFTPDHRDYIDVLADQADQNYTATAICTISGNAGTAEVTLSYTDGTPKTATSAADGSYTLTVSYNWSGTVTPSKTGFTFAPKNHKYNNVQVDQTNQNFAAKPITYTISGNAGTAGVTLSYTDVTPKTATSGADGSYTLTVSYDWSGTVTPSKTGFIFAPANRNYYNVLSDQASQNYTASAITYIISGNAGTAGVTLSYTDVTPKTATSGTDGSYSLTVSYNWSGAVTPSKTGYTFIPANLSYTNVLSDQVDQNYTAMGTCTISGNAGTVGVTLSYTDVTPKTATSASDGSYTLTVSYNWSGTVTPSKTGYTFAPANRNYYNVLTDQADQNYTATAITYIISGNAGTAVVTLSYTDVTPKTATSGADGSYTLTVSYNWSGTVTPSKTGFTFTPVNRSYTNVLSDQADQNYTASAITYIISGNAGMEGVTLSYTDGTPMTTTSAADGSYSFKVSYNWSGTVTPSKAGITFVPDHRDYANVLVDQIDQNFIIDHYSIYLPIMRVPDTTIFYDNFDSGDRGWQPMITPGGEAGIVNGYYRLYHSSANQFLAALAPVSASQIPTSGYTVEATLILVQSSNSCIGFVFDWQNSDSFQLLMIQPTTQYFWVYKWNGTYPYQLVTSGNTTVINPGLGSANVVKLVRSSSNIQVFINNTPVTGLISDAKANNVLVGLLLSVYSSFPGEGHFDDFRVSGLP